MNGVLLERPIVTRELNQNQNKRVAIESDEEYFRDERIDLRPSDVVQSKLIGILPRGMPIPVSSLHNCRQIRR